VAGSGGLSDKLCRACLLPNADDAQEEPMTEAQDPTTAFLSRLLSGDPNPLRAAFAGEPVVEDPTDGTVRGVQDFERFVRNRHGWLTERAARIEPIRTTATTQRVVFEALLRLRLAEADVELPIGIVGDRTDEQVRAIRLYHSFWPLERRHRVRPPLLQEDRAVAVADVVSEYQRALASGDADAIVATFEPDGYFREPAGGEFIHSGYTKLREFMSYILAAGGIGLEHCTVTDDGVACAIEFNAVRFGTQPLVPQSGLAVYQRGSSGRLCAARIYDDVNVEALAG
jgi:hypothetical protein